MNSVPKDQFHDRIVCDSFPKGLGDEASMLVFGILHRYQIELAGPVLSDCPNLTAGSRMAPLTQRDCGQALAAMWAGTDDERASYMFWYHRWQEWGTDARLEKLTAEQRARMRKLMDRLGSHPFVARLVPEDPSFDPASDPP